MIFLLGNNNNNNQTEKTNSNRKSPINLIVASKVIPNFPLHNTETSIGSSKLLSSSKKKRFFSFFYSFNWVSRIETKFQSSHPRKLFDNNYEKLSELEVPVNEKGEENQLIDPSFLSNTEFKPESIWDILKTKTHQISRTELEHYPNIYYGCYLEGSPLQGLKLWGPGTFYVPPGGMPAGPAPHPTQATAVAQNGTVYYHHTPVRHKRFS